MPPFATARVPARVIVPLDVTGPPLVVRPVAPPDTSTLVTVPLPQGEASAAMKAVLEGANNVPLNAARSASRPASCEGAGGAG